MYDGTSTPNIAPQDNNISTFPESSYTQEISKESQQQVETSNTESSPAANIIQEQLSVPETTKHQQTQRQVILPQPEPQAASAELQSINEIKTDKDFSYDGYQVVRGTFFAHLFEPSVTFKAEKVYVNAACIRKLPTVEFVQFLVHPEKKMLAVKPCSEDTQDSFRWCSSAPVLNKRKAKAITCKIFFAKVMSLMKWNPEYRYRIIGKLVCTPSDKIFVFNLNCAEAFRKKTANDIGTPGNTPLYPDAWMESFGIPVNEHHGDFNLEIFDEDAVFTIEKEKEAEHNTEIANDKSSEQTNDSSTSIEKEVNA